MPKQSVLRLLYIKEPSKLRSKSQPRQFSKTNRKSNYNDNISTITIAIEPAR